MKKFITLAAATIALVSSQAANAQSFVNPGTYTYVGIVTVQKDSIPLNCDITAKITNTAGVLTAHDISLSGGFLGLCASVTFLNQPYNATWSSPNAVILGFHPRAATNSTECHGDLDLVHVSGDIFTINDTIPKISGPNGGSNDCLITDGEIDLE